MRRYQIILYGRYYGTDERAETRDIEIAKRGAQNYVNCGVADGALVYDLKDWRIVYEYGERFPARCRPIERLVTA